MAAKRKYPVGIHSFESIRLDGYLYVDKPPYIYKMGQATASIANDLIILSLRYPLTIATPLCTARAGV